MVPIDWTSIVGASNVAAVAQCLSGARFLAFAGAGISRNSGLPVANELRDEILTELRVPERVRAILAEAQPPFELIVETLAQFSDPTPLFRIFQSGAPCPFHHLTAKLALEGQMVGIVTTNFDCLFEAAFVAAGLQYERIWQEHALEGWQVKAGIFPLLKVHGSAHDETSLDITVRRVAGQRGVAARETTLRQAILYTGADAILVAGYSGSDRFDINPILARLAANAPPVVLVAHDPSDSGDAIVEPLTGNEHAGPFSLFGGIRVKCNTDMLVDKIAGGHSVVPPSCTAEWHEHVRSWFHQCMSARGGAFRSFMIGALLHAAARPRDAQPWFRKATAQPADQLLKIESSLSLARCIRDVGRDLIAARGAASKALRLARAAGSNFCEISALIELGVIAADKRKLRSALRYYRQAEVLARRVNEAEKLGVALGNAAIARKNLGGARRLRRALRDHTIALEIARQAGDKRSEGRTLGNIGIVYSNLGYSNTAIDHFRKAGNIARELGDLYHEAIWLVGEAHDTFASDSARAIDLTLRARTMFEPLSMARVRECDKHLRRFGYRT